jgi:hypothetical protein
MWNDKKSIWLSQVCIFVFSAVTLLAVVFAHYIVDWLVDFSRADLAGKEAKFLATIYTGFIPASFMLYNLYALLRQISVGKMFIQVNVGYLRRISWCCMLGGIISLISAFYYSPWFVVALAASFMGLIVRVIKNMVAYGVSLQDESDYTV